MADVFGFIKKAAKGDDKAGGGVFGFLDQGRKAAFNSGKNDERKGTPITAINPANVKPALNFVRETAQSTARIAPTVAISAVEATPVGKYAKRLNGGTSTISAPNNPLFHATFGTDTIESYQTRAQGIQDKTKVPAPIAVAGLVGLDFTPGGGAKKGAVKSLIKASSVDEVKKVLPEISTDTAQSISKTKDPYIIKNLLERDGAQRSYLKTVADSPNTGDQLREATTGVIPQTYQRKSNQQLLNRAQQKVNSDYSGSLTDVLSKEKLSDEDVAVGQELIRRAQNDGRIDEAVGIVESLDTKLREAGRTVQAASLWSRLSPEGVLVLANRKIRKVREEKFGGGPEVELPQAKQIKQEIEKSGNLDRQSVGRTVDELAGTAEATGTRLAKNVEKAAAPAVKKKADTLVQELTKKVKQEYLEAKPATRRAPINILREVFGRFPEAKEAYPYAQQILRDKYQNVPGMSEALDKFFSSELGLPVSSTTINSAIKDQLKANGQKVADIIHRSWSQQRQSVDDIASDLVKSGFDEQSARLLATEVKKRLDEQVISAKRAALERLTKEAPKKAQPTYLDKLNKLSNLGALDNKDFLDLSRAKLGLPNLSNETAQKLSELSQKMQDLPDGSEKRKIVHQIGEIINQEIPKTKGEKALEILGAPKSLLSTFDLSGLGRQGAVLGSRFREDFKKAFKDQITYLASPEKYDAAMAEIASRKNLPLYERMGVALTGVKGYKNPEEAFVSQLPEEIPGIGKLVGASNRIYTGALTQLRADVADRIIKELTDAGIDVNTMPKEELESLGRFINTASGRGGKKGGWIDRHAEGLSQALFSPRLWKSRLDMLNPLYYYQLKGPARKYALESAGSFASIAGVVLGLAVLAGADVETDPRSSDFLKIRFGDTRYDILGGFQQNLVFAWRELTGEKKSSTTGNVTTFAKDIGDIITGRDNRDKGIAVSDRFTILQDLVENKENPVVATTTRALRNKDRNGEEFNPAKEAIGLVTPLAIGDTVNQVANKGPLGFLGAVPGFLGAGSQTYGIKDMTISAKPKAYIKELEQKGAPKAQIEASKRFFQYQKTGPDRDAYAKQIKEALTNKDIKKAEQIAQDYNKKYAATFKPWLEKYDQYKNDETLVKTYNSKKITSESFNRWISDIEKGAQP